MRYLARLGVTVVWRLCVQVLPMNAKSRMRGLQGVRTGRTDEWYARQLAHALECMAEADKQHTPEEIAAAEAALAVDPRCPQDHLDLRNA